MDAELSTPSRPLLAAAWMVGAIVAFSSMAVAGRELANELSSFEIMVYRSIIGVGIILLIGVGFGKLGEVRFDRLRLHGLRNIAHFAGQNLWFSALPLITLAQVFALEFTSPIWVMIFAVFFVGERLTTARILAVVLGFAGALLVARPGIGGDPLGLSLAAMSAVCFGASIVATRALTSTETTFGILFWLTITQTVLGLITTLWDGQITWPSPAAWPYVVAIGIAGLVAHTCLTKALTVAPATVVTPLDFLRLPAIAVIGMVLYSEPLNIWVLLGAGVICLGVYINLTADSQNRAAK